MEKLKVALVCLFLLVSSFFGGLFGSVFQKDQNLSGSSGNKIGGITSVSSTAVGTAGVLLLEANGNRNGVEICGISINTNAIVYIQLAQASSAPGNGIPLATSTHSCYSIGPDNLWVGPIYAISAIAATATVQQW